MNKVKIIKNCPACDSVLERVEDQLFCRNSGCSATNSKKVEHFAKAMKIKGLGEKTIEKLGIETIEDIYTLTEAHVSATIGEKLSVKLLAEIEFSKKTTIDKLLPAFSIRLIGNSASVKLAQIAESIGSITSGLCKKAGLGDIATQSLMKWIENDYPLLKTLPLNIVANTSPLVESRGIKVCMTGKLNEFSSRGLATSYLSGKGITVVSGVTKAVNYLINEDNKPSSKLSKAMEYNIPIVTIKQLIEEINK